MLHRAAPMEPAPRRALRRERLFPAHIAEKFEHLKEDVASAFESEVRILLQENESLRRQLEIVVGDSGQEGVKDLVLHAAATSCIASDLLSMEDPLMNFASSKQDAMVDLAEPIQQEALSRPHAKPSCRDEEASARPSAQVITEALHMAAASPEKEDQSVGTSSRNSVFSTLFSMARTSNTSTAAKLKGQRLSQRLRESTARRKCLIFEESSSFRCWSVVLVCVMVTAIWSDTLAYSQNWNDAGDGPLGRVFEIMVWCFFLVDIGIHFNTAFEDRHGNLVTSRMTIAKHYLKGFFVIDVASALPLHFWTNNASDASDSARLVKTLKILKALRTVKVFKFIMGAQDTGWLQDMLDDLMFQVCRELPMTEFCGYFSRVGGATLKYLLILALEVHLLVCILISRTNESAIAWTYRGRTADQLDPWMKYGVATWWVWQSFVTGTPTADLFSFSSQEIDPRGMELATTIVMVVNFMVALSIFANTKGSDDTSFEFRVRRLGFYLRGQPRVSPFMNRQAITFHRLQQRVVGLEDVQELLDELPLVMKRSLIAAVYEPAVENFGLFLEGPFCNSEEIFADICSLMKPRHHLSHDIVFAAGSIIEGMFFTLSGGLVRACDHEGKSAFSGIAGCPDVGTNEFETTGRVFGVEALFAPETAEWKVARYSVMTDCMTSLAVVNRQAFDKVVRRSMECSCFVQFIRTHVAESVISIDSLTNGLTPELIDKFDMSYAEREEKDVVSEDLGISAAYLMHSFVDEISDMGFTDSATTTFSDLAHHFWGERGDFCGFKGSAKYLCPRDGMEGSAIIDACPSELSGAATHFVSWCWKYTVETVVSALSLWVEDHHKDPSEVRFWMCFFCNNQRKMLIQREEENLTNTFGSRLSKIGHMIILLDTYEEPTYITRVWCIFETYVATTGGIKTDVAIPTAVKKVFSKTLEHGGFANIAASLSNIDAESAVASHKSDEDMIKGLIRDSIGFLAVNEQVKCALINWLASAFGDCLKLHSISEVSRHIFDMIAGKSGAATFHLTHWLKAARDHPHLLEYLDLTEMSPGDSFCLLCPPDDDVHSTVTMQDFEAYLHKQGKSNISEFAAWLRGVTGDADVDNLREGLQMELMGKLEDLSGQLAQSRMALKELRQRGISSDGEGGLQLSLTDAHKGSDNKETTFKL